MANGAADGSVIIDTGLDNTGFEKGSQKMEQSIKGVTQSINKTGRAAASSMQPLFSAFEQVGKSIDATAQRAQALDGKLSGAVSSSEFGKNMTSAERSCTSLEKQMQRLSDSERMGIKTGSQMTRFQINVEKARDSVNRLEQELQQLGTQQVATPEYESLTASVQKAEQALFRLYDRRDTMSDMGVSESSREWQRLAVQIKNAEYVLESYEKSMQSMRDNGTAYTSGADSAKYRETEATLARMSQQLSHYEQMAAEFDTVSGPASQSESALKDVDKELQRKPKDASKASSALTAFGNTLKKAASSALKATGALARMSFKAVARGAKAATASISKFFDRSDKGTLTSKGLVKALTGLRRMLISRVKEKLITTLMQGLGQSMTALAQYSSAFNASMSGMQNAAKGLSGNLAVTFGNLVNAIAPALTTIINWISTAISYLNAFFALLSGRGSVTVAKKQTDSYAKSLGGAAGAAKDLKKEVYGFDELNKASSDSNGGGGGASGAGDMFEDVPIESLLPENIQNFFASIKAAFEAGDWEGIGVIVGNGLNVVVSAVDNWITSITPLAVTWSERIARSFNGLVMGIDWPALGATLGHGINLITQTVNAFTTTFNWAAFGAKLGAGANGLVSGINWPALGVFLTTKFRALWTTIYGFVTTFNWSALGSSIAAGANAAFQSINWTQVAVGIGTGIQGIWTTFWTAVNGFDWIGASTALTTGANTAFQSIDWANVATLFGQGVSNIWTTFWTILSEFDWAGAGTSLATAVNTLFSSTEGPIDWAAAGQSVSDGLKGILDGINSFLATVNWQQIGTDVTNFIAGIDWSGMLAKLIEGFTIALVGLAELIWGLIKPAWDSVVTWWEEQMTANGGNVVAALLSGITTAFAGIVQWLIDNISTPFWNGLDAAFGLEEGQALQIATDAVTKFLNGITTALADIGTWCKDNIVTPLLSGIESALGLEDGTIAQVATDLWNGLKNGLATAWSTLKDTIVQPFKDFWQAVKDFFGIASPSTEAASVGDFILQGFGSGLSSGVQAVLDIVSDVFGRIWKAIKSIFGFGEESEESKEAKQAGKDIMTGMQEGIKGDEETVKTEIKNAAKEVLKALRSELGIPENGGSSSKSKTAGEGIVTGIKDGIVAKGVQATFTSAASSTWNAVKAALESAFGMGGFFSTSASKSKYIGEGTVSGINDGISSKGVKATFTTSASSVLTAVKDAINTAFGLEFGATSASKLKYAGEGVVSGVETGISEKAVSSTFSSVASSLYNAVSSAFNTALGISGGGLFGGASSSSKFKAVGKAICQGVADGIDANTSTIKSAATRAASAALAAAKAKLGIHSPSKAFAEIGGFMMKGMSNGLNAAKGGVMRTITNIASAVTSGFDGTLKSPEIQVASDVLFTGLDVIANKLSAIAATFTAIADVLTAVGGFHMPAVAAGTAIPYKTRVAAESPSTGKFDPVTAFTTNFDETMSDQRDLLLEIIDILRKLKIVIDGDSLTRVLTSLQRAQERSYGYGGV